MINIAIDGPSGAGKSSVAKALAKKLGYVYVDTGALYRSIGVKAMRCGIDTKDEEKVTALLPETHLDIKYIDGTQHVFVDGEDVSTAIREPEASMAASNVSAMVPVRNFLLETQREIARNNDCIMDGRDIGTVILPNAKYKIFLTASNEARAQRRYKEQCEKGIDQPYEDVLKEIIERDKNDTNRAAAPLKQADDAVLVDSSDLTFEQTVDAIEKLILL